MSLVLTFSDLLSLFVIGLVLGTVVGGTLIYRVFVRQQNGGGA